MVATYASAGKPAINPELLLNAISNATFETEEFVSKGAVSKTQSRFADPKPVDPRHQKISANLLIDIGKLPVHERALMVDLFDRYGGQKNGMLVVSQTYAAQDFDAEKSKNTILGFMENKLNKELGVSLQRSNSNELPAVLPEVTQVDVNEKSKGNILSWIAKNIAPKPSISSGPSMSP